MIRLLWSSGTYRAYGYFISRRSGEDEIYSLFSSYIARLYSMERHPCDSRILPWREPGASMSIYREI